MASAPLVGASVWEEQVYQHLTSHEEKERGLLERYQQVADSSDSAAFRYLVSMIVEEEARHHRLFRDLAETLRSDAEMRPEEPRIPRLNGWGRQREMIVEVTDRLLEQEHNDARELHRLAKQLKDVKETTLWHLLVELMEADTAKHIRILEFVNQNARHYSFGRP